MVETQTDTKRKGWIQSLEGRKLDQRHLLPSMVGSIREIAHSLAGEFRFTRQTAARYSVAEHCVVGSRLLPPVFAGAFLLHELSEVYNPDISGPLKPFVRVEVEGPDGKSILIPWAELERQHTHTMLEAYGLLSIEPLIYCPEVKRMDWAMLATEKRDLSGTEPESWGLPVPPIEGVNVKTPWPSEEAEFQFIKRFGELFGHDHPALSDTWGVA